jgi:hypothetical protein
VASNSDGIWNPSGAGFSFRLGPRFYQTWWFYGLGLMIVVLATVSAHKVRVRQLLGRERAPGVGIRGNVREFGLEQRIKP